MSEQFALLFRTVQVEIPFPNGADRATRPAINTSGNQHVRQLGSADQSSLYQKYTRISAVPKRFRIFALAPFLLYDEIG
ncbi:MAG: hypothetical protein GY768_06055 [Planctomycetaceae bacterium]|nr:hypothetical protein [Planctomycetaceae bacterium]